MTSFEDTVKNLLKMKPKPHDKAKADDGKDKKGQDEPASSKADRSVG